MGRKMKFIHCKGCKWEFDYIRCPNDYKSEMLKHNDGTLQCGYCKRFESTIKHEESD